MADLATKIQLRHLARIIESSDDAIVSKDLSGVIQSWNRSAERIFGFTAEEAIGQSIRIIVPEDRLPEEDEFLAQVKRGQGVSHVETVRQRKDKSCVHVSVTVSPIHDESGEIIGASKIARDLTERIAGDLVARRLTAVVDSSDDAIVSKDLDSTIRSWNRAAERMFGYTAQEAIGKSIRMIIPDELQSEEDGVLARIRAGQSVEHFETARQRKDGTRIHISLTVSPIRDDQGRVIGASKVARDITESVRLLAAATEQAQITQKLGEVGARLAASLEPETIAYQVTQIGTELTGAEFGALFMNESDARLGGRPVLRAQSARADNPLVKLPPLHTAALLTPVVRHGHILRLDDVTIVAGPSPVCSLLAVPVKAPSGEVIGGLFFGHSRTDAFTDQHQELAVGVASWASLALENSRLFVQARDADRLKDEFLAVLSHELRTPLSAILGYSRLLRGGLLPADKVQDGLSALERNATALNQIVDDVLDVSRIVAGKIRLNVQPVELPLVIQDAVDTVQPAAAAKGVRIHTLIDPGVGPVSGDPGRLVQVIWNLVSNGVKFTPKGGRVQIRLERVSSHAEITVSDTGAGISAEFLPHVFERFRQADSGITRKSGGLGLGLSIVRHIVEMHGGTVSASSAGEGQGTTFRIKMPLMSVHAEASSEAREHPRTERSTPMTSLVDLEGIHVLAIDDEEDALGLLRVVLETAGAEVTTLRSAIGAIERIEAANPDVLVVDLGMPEMDGFTFITNLRASTNADIRDLPAAALTAFARAEDRTRALQSGFEMHLTKPVDPRELAASVATLMRRSGRRRADSRDM
jgi:PAS domain S-box-containing protein